jgi:hypothetical protein
LSSVPFRRLAAAAAIVGRQSLCLALLLLLNLQYTIGNIRFRTNVLRLAAIWHWLAAAAAAAVREAAADGQLRAKLRESRSSEHALTGKHRDRSYCCYEETHARSASNCLKAGCSTFHWSFSLAIENGLFSASTKT